MLRRRYSPGVDEVRIGVLRNALGGPKVIHLFFGELPLCRTRDVDGQHYAPLPPDCRLPRCRSCLRRVGGSVERAPAEPDWLARLAFELEKKRERDLCKGCGHFRVMHPHPEVEPAGWCCKCPGFVEGEQTN